MPRAFLTLDYRTRCDGRFPLSRRELTRLMADILEALGLRGAQLSLTLVDDREIAGINLEFLGGDGPTNILSFPEPDSAHPAWLGALVLSVETLSREAFLYGQEPGRHLARLLAHGVLHLAGWEHGADMDELTERAVEAACPVQGDDPGVASPS